MAGSRPRRERDPFLEYFDQPRVSGNSVWKRSFQLCDFAAPCAGSIARSHAGSGLDRRGHLRCIGLGHCYSFSVRSRPSRSWSASVCRVLTLSTAVHPRGRCGRGRRCWSGPMSSRLARQRASARSLTTERLLIRVVSGAGTSVNRRHWQRRDHALARLSGRASAQIPSSCRTRVPSRVAQHLGARLTEAALESGSSTDWTRQPAGELPATRCARSGAGHRIKSADGPCERTFGVATRPSTRLVLRLHAKR